MKCLRLVMLVIPIGTMVLFSGCMNKRSATALSGTKMDTVVYSRPVDFLKALDTVDASLKFEATNYKDLLDLFEKLNYTPEAWQAGIREVPRVYLTEVGPRWSSTTTKEIEVDQKKRIFFRGLAPLILRANELIMRDRNRLEQVRSSISQNKPISETNQDWILKLAKLYKVNAGEDSVTGPLLDELWTRVDIVPPSLALAQGAEESGWGTSRFAGAGNAIYGQWTWGDNAIVPEQQRKELGNYGIAAFGSLQEAVCAYMLNLNTHNAYADLRSKRAELRRKKGKITGSILAEQLTKYSERGEEYVNTLKSLISYNRLEPADDAYLAKGPPIYLVPASR